LCLSNFVVNHVFWQKIFSLKDLVDRKENVFSTSGQECGRTSCRTCAQPEEKKEVCTQRNVVYESECARCNPPGTMQVADIEGLAERRDVASLSERSVEHWQDAEAGHQESYMFEHQALAHIGVRPLHYLPSE
jgi:hypothetical protein